LTVEALEDRTVPSGSTLGNLVVFGDSLSDVGNLSNATGGALPPSQLYFNGRFSSGPLWVDTLAEYLGAPPVKPSTAGGFNYAWAGATITTPATYLSPYSAYGTQDVDHQVNGYLSGHTPQPTDVFALWGGANDFFFSSEESGTAINPSGTPNTPVNPTVPADALAADIKTLINSGGKRFVVANVPPLGLTPWFQDKHLDAGTIAAINSWSAGFNAELSYDLAGLQAPGITIVQVDIYHLLEESAQPNNPFGFTNWTNAAGPYDSTSGILDAPYSSGYLSNPNGYLFFDSVHPTTKTHQIIGLQAAAQLSSALGVNTITVTNTSDAVNPLDGGLSLREAVNLANAMPGQQSIYFNLGAGTQTINLGNPLDLTGDVALQGPGVYRLAVSGQGSTRLLQVEAGVHASVSGLTLENGFAPQGGAIINAGTLTLRNMVLENNTANAAGGVSKGGGIYNGPGATLNVYTSLLVGNTAQGGTNDAGGAIANDGAGAVANIYLSQLYSNKALGGQALGGAVANLNGASLRVLLSVFGFNQAHGGDNPGATGGDGLGGAIYNDGTSYVDLELDCIYANLAVGGTGKIRGKGQGGGVYLASGGQASESFDRIVANFASTAGNNVYGTFGD
jgi:phospholipase/lecithinase/hemolysin